MTLPNSLSRWRFHLFLACLALLGCAMRFHDIGKRSLWSDELFTLGMALYHPLVPGAGQPWYRPASIFQSRDGDTFWTAKAAEQHPPLQDLLEKASIKLLGVSEFAARLPGALAGCALLAWFAAFAARREDPRERRALAWALLLLALSPALVAYAQEARSYSLGASLAGMGGLLWMLRWRGGWRKAAPPSWGEVALMALACYSHYNAAALVAVMMVADFAAACARRDGTTLARLAALTAAFAPWLALSAETILATSQGLVAWGSLSALEYAGATVAGASTVLHRPWLAAWAAAGAALLAWHAWRRRGPARDGWPQWLVQALALSNLLLIYLVLAGFIAAKAGMAHARFYIFAVPVFAAACGLLLSQLRHRFSAAAAAALVAASAWPGSYPAEFDSNQDYRGATQAALRGFGEGDKILYPWQPNRDLYRVYAESLLGGDVRARMVGVGPASAEQACAGLAGAPQVAVMGHDFGRDLIQEVYATCGSRWPLRERHALHNTFAELWRTGPHAGMP